MKCHAELLQNACADAAKALQFTQKSQAKYFNKHFKLMFFKIGNMVCVNAKNI
jgi:hypothetical protein